MRKNLLSFILVFFILQSNAQWNPDTLVRNPICTSPNQQLSPQLCTDGAKGAIITWTDARNNPQQIYAQRIDSNGIIKWTNNGLLATPGAINGNVAYPVSDGSGGAIIVYELSIPGGITHIHAQRLDANGNALWGNNGVRIDTSGEARLGNYVGQVVSEDGNGGAFMSWQHTFFGGNEVRIQHIDHNGNLLLTNQGLAVSNNTTVHYSSKIISTGNNTCVVAYEQQGKLFMQRINGTGAKMWGAGDLQITNTMTTITSNNFFIQNTSAKNIAVAWEDIRNPSIDIYAQKTDTSGVIKWTAGGIIIDNSAINTLLPELVADNNDGVFISYGFSLAFVQHVNAGGQLLWGAGKNVSTLPNQTAQHSWTDGNNGLIVSWESNLPGPTQRIFAQHYDSSGTALWRPNGLPVAITGNNGISANNRTMGLNSGRVIAVWEDYRNGPGGADIYSARFGNNAILTPAFTATNTCFGDSTQFNDITISTASTVNFWQWNFGDGTPLATIKNPKHKYAATGNYSVTLTLMDDEFNYRVISQQLSISSKPVVNLGNDTVICAGTSISLNASNPGLQYLWSTSATTQTIAVNSAGTYWVRVTNGACSASDTIIVSVKPLSQAAFTYVKNNLSVQFANTSINGVSYSWSFGDGATDTAASPTHVYANSGNYSVKLFATNSCKTDSVIQIVSVTKPGILIDSCGSDLTVKIFPNPFHDILFIKFYTPAMVNVLIRIINSIGQTVNGYEFAGIQCGEKKSMDLRSLPAGVYILDIRYNGKKIMRKLLRQ